MYFVLYRSAS